MAKRTKKRVFITGASRGIGRATALALAARGDDLVLAARTRSELEDVAIQVRAAGADAQAVEMDVTDDRSVEVAVDAVLSGGPVDVLVNNAGVFEQRAFLVQDPAVQRNEMEVNYFGVLRVTRRVLPQMLARGEGTIVNVSSIVGSIPCPSVANYSATKAALDAWTHALRGELEGRGVRLSVFVPSHTATKEAKDKTRFEGVPSMPVEYTAAHLVRAIDKAPRRYVGNPVFKVFLRAAGLLPTWAEGQMKATTRALLVEPARLTAETPR